MAKEYEGIYTPKPWELSRFVLEQWENREVINVPFAGVNIQRAEATHLKQVVKLISGNQALVGVGNTAEATKTAEEFISGDRALVGLAGDEVVSFQACGVWRFGYCELRSARTADSHTGIGLNLTMKKLMIYGAWEKFRLPFIGFTEATSMSRNILLKLGFQELSMTIVHRGLAEACPKPEDFPGGDKCALRSGGDCGCKVYLLDIEKGVYEA